MVDELNASTTEEFLDSLPGPFSNPTAVAVAPPGGPSAGDVYVGEYNKGAATGGVDVYSPDLLVPTVSPEPVAEPKPKDVILKGTVNPEKLTVTSCEFEYGDDDFVR